MKHIAWLFAFAACTDFTSVDRDVCGNGLLEAGEDCDSGDASCVSCAIVCATAAECPTTDYVCGTDSRCHAAGGALGTPQVAGTFRADDMSITDIDADGIGDLVGLSKTSINIRFGDETGQLDQLTSILTPTQTGPAAFGDLDGDGSLDVSLTTPDGIVTYASPYGELAPVPVNERLVDPDTGDPLNIERFFNISANIFSALVVEPTNDALAILVLDGNAANPTNVFELPCLARIGKISKAEYEAGTVSIYNVHQRGDSTLDTLISLQTGTGASRTLCVISIHRDAPAAFVVPPFEITDITPVSLGTPTLPVVFADLDYDADRCPGLVRQDMGVAALKFVDANIVNEICTYDTGALANLVIDAPAGTRLLGHGPVSPYVPFVSGDALVTSEGVYIRFIGTFYNVYRTTRKITDFGYGDVDGDGAVDLVIGAEGEEDLDILLRVLGEAGFNLVRLDTASTVNSLNIGDYDGNRIDDISYTEQLEDHVRLMVSYGTTDRTLEPISMGQFPEILHVDPISLADSIDYLGISEDLVVFQPPPPGSPARRVTLMHGLPQRVMLSYFDPRPDAVKDGTLFRGSVIGNFTDAMSSAAHTDVIAIAPGRADSKTDANTVRAWQIPGTPEGLDGTVTQGVTLTGVSDCSVANNSTLCLDVARYLAFPTGPDHDVVIGIDRAQRAILVDPWVPVASVTALKLDTLSAVIPAKTVPRSLYASDLDGDAAPELVAAFAPVLASGATGAVIVCKMNGGIPESCEDLVPAIKEAAAAAGIDVAQCYDAVPARLSLRARDATVADASFDLAVACRGEGSSVFRVHHTSAGNEIVRIAAIGENISAIRAGDVTGDHVDDLIVLAGEQVTSLTVYPQCTNRDLACIGGQP